MGGAITLSEEQKRPANIASGRMLIVAGPGSGKTRVVVERVRVMVDAGALPETFVLITFTTRAADELKDRLEVKGIHVGFAGTIHSLCYRILTTYLDDDGLGYGFTVLSPFDRDRILTYLVERHALKASAHAVAKFMDEQHAAGVFIDAGLPLDRKSTHVNYACKVYRDWKRRHNCEDYAGLIDRVRLRLRTDPLAAWVLRERFMHWTIDEAQDLDAAQVDLIGLLSPPDLATRASGKSLVLIGDPMQNVYSWRGARSEFMYQIDPHHEFTLRTNYRSDELIVRTTRNIADRDYLTMPGRPPGTVRLASCSSEEMEAAWIAEQIDVRNSHGIGLSQIAVLARLRRQLLPIAAALTDRGIPYQIVGGTADLIERASVQEAIALMRLALNPYHDYFAERVLISLRNMYGTPDLHALQEQAAQHGSLWRAWIAHVFQPGSPDKTFHQDGWTARIETLRDPEVHEDVAIWPGYIEQWCETLGNYYNCDGENPPFAEDLSLFVERIRKYLKFNMRGRRTMRQFLWWLLFARGADELDPEPSVTLSTVHLSKGMEWDTVMIPGMSEGTLPHKIALRSESGVAAETRVFFVAVSRAKTTLMLSRHTEDGAGPSRFLGWVAEA